MKKLLLLSAVLVASTGCSGSWRQMYRGSPCNGCSAPTLPAASSCSDCGTSSGYAPSYGSSSFGDSSYQSMPLGEQVISGPYYSDPATTGNSPMGAIGAPGGI